MQDSNLQELGQSVLDSFDRRVAAIPQELCAPFHSEARQLEAELLTIYKMVALCVKPMENTNEIAAFWGLMVNVCDLAAKRLSKVVAEHPHCGADCYYDRVLELRSKCQRLQKMHA